MPVRVDFFFFSRFHPGWNDAGKQKQGQPTPAACCGYLFEMTNGSHII
jgi:hypothetical protein